MDAQQSIAISYRQCDASLSDLCTLLKSQANPEGAVVVEFKSIENERGRFRVWAGNIGAHQIGGRASLDYRLQEASDVKSEVIKIVDYLKRTVVRLSAVVTNGGITFDKDFSSDSDSEPSDEARSRRQLSAANSSQSLLQDIRETINSLYKLSIAIRNPAPHDRYLSISVSHFETVDIQHALDKFPKLIGNKKLAERLGISNSKRRQKLKYRQQHAEKLSKNIEQPHIHEWPLARSQQKSYPDKTTNIFAGTKPSEIASTSASEYVGASPEIDDIESNAFSQTSYALSTVIADGGLLRIPSPPEECLNGLPFVCPYCCLECDIKNHQWQKHVFQDLQPYICTFGNCPNQDTLFESRNEWFNHELQLHRQRWLCHKCNYFSTNRVEFESHQKELHLRDFTQAQISTFVGTCQRPVEDIPLSDCPLCHTDDVQPVSGVSNDTSSKLHPSTLSAANFRRHLSHHLQQLALFVLPRDYCEDDKDLNSNRIESDVQSGIVEPWINSEASSSIVEVSPFIPQQTNTPLQFPQHVHEHLDASVGRLILFCHSCRHEWYHEPGDNDDCPQCKGSATQMVTLDDDPRYRKRETQDISGSIYNSQQIGIGIGAGKGKEPENSTTRTNFNTDIPDFRNRIYDIGVLSSLSVDHGPVVVCHSCHKEWYQNVWGIACPECQSDYVEIMDGFETAKDYGPVDGERPVSPKALPPENHIPPAFEEIITPTEVRDPEPESFDIGNAIATRYHGRRALQEAAGGGHLAVVERLLQEKADVNVVSGRYGTALQAAADGGHLAVVERLLQEKADVNIVSGLYGQTALQAAAGGGHFAVVKRLLQEKAEVNFESGLYGTALQAAAGGGHLAVVERLLQEKADVNIISGLYEQTALHAAARGGHFAVVKRLLQEKAEVNFAASGRTKNQHAEEKTTSEESKSNAFS